MRYSLGFLVAAALAATVTSASAGKVNMPREGNFEFTFCSIGDGKIMSSGDQVFASHYAVAANLLTQPAGKAFDRTSGVCRGVYAKLNGHPQEFGVCEFIDADGDQWWMEYHGNAEGSGGTYTGVHGTGKYDGMTLKGGYTLDFWPSATKDLIQACNPNKGTYKLR